jgi:hypothetical protein
LANCALGFKVLSGIQGSKRKDIKSVRAIFFRHEVQGTRFRVGL